MSATRIIVQSEAPQAHYAKTKLVQLYTQIKEKTNDTFKIPLIRHKVTHLTIH